MSDNKGYLFGLVNFRSVFRCNSFGTCDVNAFYLLVKERQIISTFIKTRFEFISAKCESLVRRTNTAKSKS